MRVEQIKRIIVEEGEQNSPWLSFQEACQRLNVGERLLRRELIEGRIPGTRIGRLWRIHKDDLDQAIRDRASGDLK